MDGMITAHRIARFHLVMTFVWMAAIVPTMLYWRESVLWVAFMSLWANIASHAAAYSAAKTEEKVDTDPSLATMGEGSMVGET